MTADRATTAASSAPRRYPRTVLVVDDDPSVRTLMEMVLEAEGFTVRCASGGDEALIMVAEERPDLILVDVMMPGMDGRALTRQLRDDPATRTLPVVICSALADDPDQWEAWASGANSFVPKPFDVSRLVAELAAAHASALASS